MCTKSVALLSFFDYNLQESGNGIRLCHLPYRTKTCIFLSCVRCSLSGPCVWKKKPFKFPNFVIRHACASSCIHVPPCLSTLNVVAFGGRLKVCLKIPCVVWCVLNIFLL
jgi:hypothetical protein